jgi:hypothetical protein
VKYLVRKKDTQTDIKAFGGSKSATCCTTVQNPPVLLKKGALWFRQAIKEQKKKIRMCQGSRTVLISRILKLSACGFAIDNGYVRKVAFKFSQSNGITQKLSVIKKVAGNFT